MPDHTYVLEGFDAQGIFAGYVHVAPGVNTDEFAKQVLTEAGATEIRTAELMEAGEVR